MIVIDTFPYNGDEILPFRLEHLYDYVDYFVIVESLETFSGRRKPEYLIDKVLSSLSKYHDKLVIVRVEQLSPRPDWYTFSSNNNPDDWWRERAQRDACKGAIANLTHSEPFIALVGDVDEFPSRKLLSDREWLYAASWDPLCLKMDFFYYNFTWKKKSKWDQYYVKNDHGFYNGMLSDYKVFGDRQNFVNDGWHFSYFMSKENIIRKIEGIGHTEVNRDSFKTHDHIKKCFLSGKDLFNRGPHEDCVLNVDYKSLPEGWEKFRLQLRSIQ